MAQSIITSYVLFYSRYIIIEKINEQFSVMSIGLNWNVLHLLINRFIVFVQILDLLHHISKKLQICCEKHPQRDIFQVSRTSMQIYGLGVTILLYMFFFKKYVKTIRQYNSFVKEIKHDYKMSYFTSDFQLGGKYFILDVYYLKK